MSLNIIMQKLQLLILIAFLVSVNHSFSQGENKLLNDCIASSGKDATYLKDFTINLPEAANKQRPPVLKNSIILRKNTTYRFTVCSGGNSDSEAIIQLFDTQRLIASTYNKKTGKCYKSFNFRCSKTGPYNIFFYFKEGKKGNAVGILSYVKKK